MIVDARMGEVRRHGGDRAGAAHLEEFGVAGGVELEDGGAELEALRPFGPAAAGVAAVYGADGRALRRVPGLGEREDLHGREIEQAVEFGEE